MTRRRLTAGAWGTLAVLTAVALGLGVHATTRPEVPTRATVVAGDLGEEIVVAGVRLSVEGARAAPRLLILDDEDVPAPVSTSGEWLVLSVAFTGERSSVDVDSYLWRSDDGVEYALSDRVDRDRGTAQPGEWWHEDLVFEVPPEAATSGTLRIEPEGVAWEVPLELGDVRVRDVTRAEEIEPAPLTPGRTR